MNLTIDKREATILKGIAIIMMVAMHLMNADGYVASGVIIDLRFSNEILAHIIAESIHMSTAIFAFLSGYVWYSSFNNKSVFKRILGVYISYWICSLIVNIPVLALCSFTGTVSQVQITPLNLILIVLGVSNDVSTYCWYIPFFALAALSYPLFLRIEKHLNIQNPILELIIVLIFFMALRVGITIARQHIVFSEHLLGLLYHYVVTMPKLIYGTIFRKIKWGGGVKQSCQIRLRHVRCFCC